MTTTTQRLNIAGVVRGWLADGYDYWAYARTGNHARGDYQAIPAPTVKPIGRGHVEPSWPIVDADVRPDKLLESRRRLMRQIKEAVAEGAEYAPDGGTIRFAR